MSKISAIDSDTSNMNDIPLGYYYYYIPVEDLKYGLFLGNCAAVESLTYNPFLTDENVTYMETPYDTDTYGQINTGGCTLKRILSSSKVTMQLCDYYKLFNWDTPLDMKLQFYPYRYFLITDYVNEPLLIKPQLVLDTDNNLIVNIETTPISGRYKLYVKNYKGDSSGKLEGIINNITYQLPVSSSAYSQFYATSMSSFNTNISNALIENDVSLRQATTTANLNLKQNNINGVINSLSSLLNGQFGSAATSGIAAYQQYEQIQNTLNNIQENATIKESEIIAEKNAKINDLLNTPNSIKTSGNDSIFNLMLNGRNIDIVEYGITDQYEKRIDNYFKMYGYAYNDYGIPNFSNRKYYNFIKCSVATIISDNIPRDDIEEIKAIFESGITFWHIENNAVPLEYNVDNICVE